MEGGNGVGLSPAPLAPLAPLARPSLPLIN